MGEQKQGSNPHIRAIVWVREKHLRLRVKQLICGRLNGMRIRQSLHSHTYPGQGFRSPSRCSGWELEFRDCGAIPGKGLLMTAERWIEGMWGRRLWWEMPVEESPAATGARRYCWVTRRGWSPHHSLSYPTRQHPQQTIEMLAHQMPDALYCRGGPQPRGPSKCLNGWNYAEKLAKEAFWLPAKEAWIKTLIGP